MELWKSILKYGINKFKTEKLRTKQVQILQNTKIYSFSKQEIKPTGSIQTMNFRISVISIIKLVFLSISLKYGIFL